MGVGEEGDPGYERGSERWKLRETQRCRKTAIESGLEKAAGRWGQTDSRDQRGVRFKCKFGRPQTWAGLWLCPRLMTQHIQPLIPDLGAGTPGHRPCSFGEGAGDPPSTIGMVGVQLQEPSGSTRQAMRAADTGGDD